MFSRNLISYSCTSLFYYLQRQKLHEKPQLSLSSFFAIYFHFSDIFLNYSSRLNFADHNIREILRELNFTDKNFSDNGMDYISW